MACVCGGHSGWKRWRTCRGCKPAASLAHLACQGLAWLLGAGRGEVGWENSTWRQRSGELATGTGQARQAREGSRPAFMQLLPLASAILQFYAAINWHSVVNARSTPMFTRHLLVTVLARDVKAQKKAGKV